jgi:TonB family protein
MNAYASRIEFETIQARTRKMIGVSVIIHAAIVLWLILYRVVAPPPPTLTEVSWLEPVAITPPKPSVTVKVAQPAVQRDLPEPKQTPAHFVRKTTTSDFAPEPQDRAVTEDKLKRTLSRMERKAVQSNTRISGIAEAKHMTTTSLASVPNAASTGQESVKLTRETKSSPNPIALTRINHAAKAAPVTLTKPPEKKVTQATISDENSTAQRILDGAKLVGPVADRPLVSYVKPVYPEWAKKDGVEATVNLYFIVLPNGTVKENILIQKTSGFADFDKSAMEALQTWKFEPLKGGETGEQWGSITFNFRLSN